VKDKRGRKSVGTEGLMERGWLFIGDGGGIAKWLFFSAVDSKELHRNHPIPENRGNSDQSRVVNRYINFCWLVSQCVTERVFCCQICGCPKQKVANLTTRICLLLHETFRHLSRHLVQSRHKM